MKFWLQTRHTARLIVRLTILHLFGHAHVVKEATPARCLKARDGASPRRQRSEAPRLTVSGHVCRSCVLLFRRPATIAQHRQLSAREHTEWQPHNRDTPGPSLCRNNPSPSPETPAHISTQGHYHSGRHQQQIPGYPGRAHSRGLLRRGACGLCRLRRAVGPGEQGTLRGRVLQDVQGVQGQGRRAAWLQHLGLVRGPQRRLLDDGHPPPHHGRLLAQVPGRLGWQCRQEGIEPRDQSQGKVHARVQERAQDCAGDDTLGGGARQQQEGDVRQRLWVARCRKLCQSQAPAALGQPGAGSSGIAGARSTAMLKGIQLGHRANLPEGQALCIVFHLLLPSTQSEQGF